MWIIAPVERSVCELAHTNSVFCADAPTIRPAQGGAPRLSTLRWVDDAKGKLLSQVGDKNEVSIDPRGKERTESTHKSSEKILCFKVILPKPR
jgi:hypothetical protein